jgi:hypothetical protein
MRWAIFTIALGFSLILGPSLSAQRGIELHGTPASVTSPTVDGRLRGIPASVTDPRARSMTAGRHDHDRRHDHNRDGRQVYAVPYYGYYVPLDAYSDYDQSDQSQQQGQQPGQPAEDEEQASQPDDSPRYGNHSFDGRDTRQLDEDRVVAQARPVPSPATAPDESPMTTLVYRDGHKSEIRNYAIVGNNLIDLSRSPVLKKIPLDSLDLAATSKENEANGVDFHAP